MGNFASLVCSGSCEFFLQFVCILCMLLQLLNFTEFWVQTRMLKAQIETHLKPSGFTCKTKFSKVQIKEFTWKLQPTLSQLNESRQALHGFVRNIPWSSSQVLVLLYLQKWALYTHYTLICQMTFSLNCYLKSLFLTLSGPLGNKLLFPQSLFPCFRTKGFSDHGYAPSVIIYKD